MSQADFPGAWRRNDWLLKNCAPLIANSPEEFADFCLQLLLQDEMEYALDRETELGFSHRHKFFPPAHLKPPFLMLLNRDEECGLRLIHGVINAGVSRWKQLVESGQGINGARRLLPVTIEVDGQTPSCGAMKRFTDGSALISGVRGYPGRADGARSMDGRADRARASC